MKKHITLVLIVFCISFISLNAQYKKKVVSYVNKVLVPSGFELSSRQTDFIASSVSKSVVMERFNYSSLPENVIADFSNEASKMNSFSASTVRPLIEKTLAPKFLELLDFNKELLSKQNLTESERNTFLATKAQSAGLSAVQLESILNSGFFYVPYVEFYHRSSSRGERDIKNKEGKVVRKQQYTTYTHSIKIGLLWFKLNVDKSNNATVSFIGAAKGWDDNEISRSGDQDDGTEGNADWDAFETAVKVSSVNIENETKKLEEFKLTGGVTEVTMFGINLNLGTREGLGLDDSYWVEELEENESGEIIKNRRGFIKIREVGNNKKDESATSYAQTITGTNYSPGLSVTEIPMLGANAVIGFGKLPIVISEFNKKSNPTKFGLSKYDFAINVNSELQNTFGPMASVQANLAKSLTISELWLQFGGALGFLNVDGKFFLPKYNSLGTQTGIDSTSDVGFSLTGYASVGLLKKFYFRRFGLVFQGDLKYLLSSFSATGKDKNNDDLTYSLTHSALGFAGKAGMEIYINPALSIGGGIEYTGAGSGDTWSISVEDKDKNETKLDKATGPNVKYSGIGWFVWINYSLPSLK